jgi:pimeloyl-ACP methyl ester carboxylesterase
MLPDGVRRPRAAFENMPEFKRDGLRLHYEDLGGPPEKTVVLLHGLLISARMMELYAEALKQRFRPVTLDLHGHGASSRPREASRYTMSEFAKDLIALADHLELERIGVFGTSLGADAALEAMLDAPDRFAAAVLEMPVLERGAKFARRAFKPFAVAMKTRYAPRMLRTVARRLPRNRLFAGFPEAAKILAQDPLVGVAVIEGLLAEERSDRWADVEGCPVPTLVIAHRRDPLHAFGDAQQLARRLPNGRLLVADGPTELRLRPRRIMAEVNTFLERAFDQVAEAPGRASG